jgi:large subunit ribosomal protein L20
MRVRKGQTKKQKHRKVIKEAKGFRWGRSNVFSLAKNAVNKARQHAYVGRKKKKADFRRLWITRLSAALKLNGASYSRFQNSLKKANVTLNRKILADLAVREPEVFSKIVDQVSP